MMKCRTWISSLLAKFKRDRIPDHSWVEEGILLVDKPVGPTSFGVIRFLKKKMNIKKMGHAGTLDPLASGLLVIAVGKVGTKKISGYIKKDKTYIADILLGKRTTTGDMEGDIVAHSDLSHYDIDSLCSIVAEIIQNLPGEHHLPVPLYSAIKVQGRPLYWYARKGIEPPEIPTKMMRVIDARHLQCYRDEENNPHAIVQLHVDSGVYIRALAEYIGDQINIPTTLSGLRRVAIDDLHVNNAYQPPMI